LHNGSHGSSEVFLFLFPHSFSLIVTSEVNACSAFSSSKDVTVCSLSSKDVTVHSLVLQYDSSQSWFSCATQSTSASRYNILLVLL
jgi:hypothetical protein